MLKPEQEKIISENLSKMETVEEVFNYMQTTFDLKSCKITGSIVGPQFRKGMLAAIKLLNPKLK